MTNSLDFRYNKPDVIKEISDYIDILKRKQMDYSVLLYGIKLPDYLSTLINKTMNRTELFRLLSDNNWQIVRNGEEGEITWVLMAMKHGE